MRDKTTGPDTNSTKFRVFEKADKIITNCVIAYVFLFPIALTFFIDRLLKLEEGMTSAWDEGVYIGPLIFGFIISFYTGMWTGKFWKWIVKKQGYEHYI